MLKLKYIMSIIIPWFLSVPAAASLDLAAKINCTYQKGQFLSKDESSNQNNSKPLKWVFNGLKSKKPIFVSGGDTGNVIAVSIENGMAIYLPSSRGTSTFTIWNTGESFWSKQSNIIGDVYSQQFIGKCVN